MRARIITIGDEILNGQTLDSNSQWISLKMAELSVQVVEATAIADTKEAIVKALDESVGKYDWIFMTGGLGPTKDDITKLTLADYFQSEMVFVQEAWDHIVELFEKRGRPVAKANKGQADVPEKSTYLPNRAGTAPGMLFEEKGSRLVSMPGVPYEMKYIMRHHILPKVEEEIKGKIINRHFRTVGIPESILADRLEDFEESLPEFIRMAYLPSPGQVKLRLTARGENGENLKEALDHAEKELRKDLGNDLAGNTEAQLAHIVGELLKASGKTLSVAESCTGGSIGQALVAEAGASAFFEGGVIAYSYAAKSDILGVNPETIKTEGAVSESVVKAMAEGVRDKFKSDFALATSGVAGPEGGTEDKPVGTVWMAMAGDFETVAVQHHFFKNRKLNIELTVVSALDMLRRKLVSEQEVIV